ncbi:MAG TPA: double zinc ribbon domain-containing protein, partial [Patescibacteria group bacterium]|nr:double zinc ribbon domain-containing protein [Patescibacteria group bacterium]
MSFLDFLFPKYCIGCKKMGSYLCSDCFVKISFAETGFCTICQKAAVGGLTHPICKRKLTIEGVFASLVYVGVVKKLVYQFKYKPYLTNLRG